MLESAAELIRTRGLEGASFTEVVRASGAARGAIYHHFPGGKQQLAKEAAQLTERMFLTRMKSAAYESPQDVLSTFLSLIREIHASPGGPGCAVGAVVQDSAGASPELLREANRIFRQWAAVLEQQLVDTGIARPAAKSFATLMIASLEGVHLLARAATNRDSLDDIERALRTALNSLSDETRVDASAKR